MKVLFANNYYYLRGGAERVFFDEMDLLTKKHHEIIPFSRHFEKNIPSEYAQYFPSEFSYKGVPFSGRLIAGFKLIYSFECRNQFRKLLNDMKPDLVHAHNIYGRLTSSIIDAAKAKKIPVIMTLHDYKLVCPSYLMLSSGSPCERCKGKRFYYCILTRCHKNNFIASAVYTLEAYFNSWLKKYNLVNFFICPSMFSLKKHLEAGIPEDKLVYLSNFIKVESFEPKYGIGDYILYVGRLSKEKGITTLLNTIKGLDMKLKIVGDGPVREDCERFARENSLKNVEFVGYKSGEELKELYRNSALLVMPSEWYENAPMTILEAFAYGKPVIGSDIGGIPEMVVDGETGLLFEAGNYYDLREKIRYLISNPSLIIGMGKKARKKVEEEHNAEVHYNRLMRVYEKALS